VPVRHVDHQGDRAAVGKDDVIDIVTRLRKDRILIERDHLKFGLEQIELRCRQCRKKAIAHSSARLHRGEPAVTRLRRSPSGVSRNEQFNIDQIFSLRVLTQTRFNNKLQTLGREADFLLAGP
jgi:hypothetical protein